MNQKRNTLKKVAGASAVAALSPSSWTKPIVNSIVLPTHAQTSSDDRLVIDGFQWGCTPFINTPIVSYDVDDRAGSPKLVKIFGCCVNARAILMTSDIFEGGRDGDFSTRILIEIEEERVISSNVTCFGSAEPSPLGNYRFEFLSLMGNPWQVEFSVVRADDPSSYIFSDFIITPVTN